MIMLDAEINSPHEQPDRFRGKLVAFHDEVEVAAGFYPEQFPVFIWRIPPHIQEDFGSNQAHELIRAADALPVNETHVSEYRVTFRGRRVPLQVTLYRYAAEGGQGGEAIAFYAKTAATLAHLIEHEVAGFYSQLSGQPEEKKQENISGIRRKIHLQET